MEVINLFNNGTTCQMLCNLFFVYLKDMYHLNSQQDGSCKTPYNSGWLVELVELNCNIKRQLITLVRFWRASFNYHLLLLHVLH